MRTIFKSKLLIVASLLFFVAGYFIATSYSSFAFRVVDSVFTTFAVQLRSDSLTPVMLALSWWGVYGIVGLWSVLTLTFVFKRQFGMALLMIILGLGGFGFESGLKEIIQRPRPMMDMLAAEHTFSLPSGHVFNAVVLYMTLCLLLYRYSRKFFLSLFAFTLSLALVFAIGFSRLYLGVHYFSDIAAGFSFGLGYFFAVIALARILLFLV